MFTRFIFFLIIIFYSHKMLMAESLWSIKDKSGEMEIIFDLDEIYEKDETRITKIIRWVKKPSKTFQNSSIDNLILDCKGPSPRVKITHQENYQSGNNYNYLLYMLDSEKYPISLYSGIGVVLSQNNNKQILIESVVTDSPASKSNINNGDIITAVDNKSLANLTLEESVDLIVGDRGTSVSLKILRQNKQFTVKINRGTQSLSKNKAHFLGSGFKGSPTWELIKINNSFLYPIFKKVCSHKNVISHNEPKLMVNWTYGSNLKNNTMAMFYDEESLEVIGDIRIINLLIDYSHAAADDSLSNVLFDFQIDCLRGKSRAWTGRHIKYKLNVAKGNIVDNYEDGYYEKWQESQDRSMQKITEDKICSIPTLIK